MARLLSLVMVLALVAAPAYAEIYRWVDGTGAVHLDDDLSRVPEAQRGDAKVFRAKAITAPAQQTQGPTQATFASGLARELGLAKHDLQDPVSVLGVVGVYPAGGWHPAAVLSTPVVEQVLGSVVSAARGGRLAQSEASAQATVIRIAKGLGVAAPPPTVVAEPPRPAEPPPAIVFAPNIIVESRPQVVVRIPEPAPQLVLSRHPTFGYGYGVPFAPLPHRRFSGPLPDRIPPLSSPAGRLHGPLVEPLRLQPFSRPVGF